MTKPLIGLTGRFGMSEELEKLPEGLHGMPLNVFWADYATAVQSAGGVPVYIPMDSNLDDLMAVLDGVLITGGADIDPAVYGHEMHPETAEVDPIRDQHELAVFAAAAEADIPILGICRGVQLMNVARGGTLIQHDPAHQRTDVPPHSLTHGVEFAEGSILHDLYGPDRQVNSLHHQVIDEIADGFAPVATAPDGEVEGLQHENGRILGVQWHPEMMKTRDSDPIFEWLTSISADSSS